MGGFDLAENKYNCVYKVYFKGLKKQNDTLLNITFLNDASEEYLEDFPHFMLIVNERSRKKTAHSFSNIQEIITLGEATKKDIAQFIVVLLTETEAELPASKQGLLIGKMSDNRFKILGYWPRVVKTSQTGSDPDYNLLFQDVIAHEGKYADVLIIT